MYKPRDQLEKENKQYKVAGIVSSVLLLAVIVFISANNISTTEAADGYKNKYEEQKSKYDDLIRSGTCLDRLPATAP